MLNIWGYLFSGSTYTIKLDVGTLRIAPTGAAEAESPGAIPVCLFVYSSNKWVPCYHDWLS